MGSFAPELFGIVKFALLPELRGFLGESLLVSGVAALGARPNGKDDERRNDDGDRRKDWRAKE